MPLQRSNREQLSGHFFYVRRLAVAVSRFSVRMKHDDRKARAAVVASFAVTLVICLVMVALGWFKPRGLVDQGPIVMDRDTGAIYAMVNGRLHPAWNLTSARLATGTPGAAKKVAGSEIAKFPTGPRVGIPDAPPSDTPINDVSVSSWAACDTAESTRAGGGEASVTAIAGPLVDGDGRAQPLPDGRAVLVSHGGSTFVVAGGVRSRVDLADAAVTVNLGLDPGQVAAMPISNALFDALPATEPLVVPAVPDAGAVAPFPSLRGLPVGSVVQVQDAARGPDRFYVVLMSGVQQISGFTANLLRTANSYGESAIPVMSPDKIVGIPQVDVLNVGFHPSGSLTFVDTAVNPVLCVSWQKARDDRQARVTVLSGRSLPIPDGVRPVKLVRDDRDPSSVEATDAVVLPGAANFVASTSGVVTSETKEGLWWLSPQGVRFGIARDPDTVRALGFGESRDSTDPVSMAAGRALQAPWPLLRMFADGPELSRARALALRDTVGVTGPVEAVGGQQGGKG